MANIVYHLRIFSDGPNGGNPLPVVVDAGGMSDDDMQQVARDSGHESGFVFPAPADSDCDFEFRYWVPEHEMEMCGHATIGAVWLLERFGRLSGDHVRILTKSGIVEANVSRRSQNTWIEISQGEGVVNDIPVDSAVGVELLATLGIEKRLLASGYSIQNAKTSRVKTVIPLSSVDVLNSLYPQLSNVQQLCERLGSTGLYPYALSEGKVFHARQFPKNSGYPEDAATGIAAAALAFALLKNSLVDIKDEVTVKQGEAMGAPSSINIRFRNGSDGDGKVAGCWVGGTAILKPW